MKYPQYQCTNLLQLSNIPSVSKRLNGYSNLIPDPIMWGGGCHKIENGGRLNLHVDYNISPKVKV